MTLRLPAAFPPTVLLLAPPLQVDPVQPVALGAGAGDDGADVVSLDEGAGRGLQEDAPGGVAGNQVAPPWQPAGLRVDGAGAADGVGGAGIHMDAETAVADGGGPRSVRADEVAHDGGAVGARVFEEEAI